MRTQLIPEFTDPEIDNAYQEDFLPELDYADIKVTDDGRVRAHVRGASCVMEYVGRRWENV